MVWPEFVPILCEGMSVFTAIVFFFLGIGAVFLYQLFQKEVKRLDGDIKEAVMQTEEKIEDKKSKVDLLFIKIDTTTRDISEIKSQVARTDEDV